MLKYSKFLLLSAFVSPVPMERGTGKRIRDEFFTRMSEDSNIWICKCGNKRKVSGLGYSNLVDHIRRDHSNDLELFLSEGAKSGMSVPASPTEGNLFFRRKTVHIHGWIHLIVLGLQPYSIVQNPIFKQHIKYDSISKESLSKNLALLTGRVENKIGELLPEKLAIVFDGWTTNSTHYIALYGTFPDTSDVEYSKILLAFSPLESEENQNAENHVRSFKFVLSIYGKSVENVVGIFGDNCNTNKKISNILKKGFVDCFSHRFNLAVQDIVTELVTTVRKLMQKLSNPITAAKLRKFTDLRSITNNVTSWSSTAAMMKRCIELRDFVCIIEDDDLANLIPTVTQYRKIKKLCGIFSDLDSVTLALQKDSITIADAMSLFSTFVYEFPEMKSRIDLKSKIVHHPDFEIGIEII